MKKIILTICMVLTLSNGMTAHAEEIPDHEYIESQIWQDIWLGKDDDGTQFPEASYKHHLLDNWISENYDSDEYNWSDVEELKYSYRQYYKNLTENWDFDDDSGNWTIQTDEHTYSFTLFQNEWLMLDENEKTVDTFPIFSTLQSTSENVLIKDESENPDSPKIKGNFENNSQEVSAEPESAEIPQNKSILPIAVVGIAIVGAIVIYLFRKR